MSWDWTRDLSVLWQKSGTIMPPPLRLTQYGFNLAQLEKEQNSKMKTNEEKIMLKFPIEVKFTSEGGESNQDSPLFNRTC